MSHLCQSCNYVFGVSSSFVDHKKICKESNGVCRTILDSIIDEAVGGKTWEKVTKPKRVNIS